MASYLGQSPYGQTVRTVTSVVATAGQTTVYPIGGYTVGYIDVWVNGSKLTETTDFTATDGLSVVFSPALDLDDQVEIIVYGAFSMVDALRRGGDTMTGTYYTQDLIPGANNTYNLGSATARYSDIYLSNGSIYIGDSVVISANATNLIIANTTGGALALSNTSFPNTGVTAGTYGNSSAIPVLTVDSTGRVTSATTNAVAGVTGFTYTTANATFTITTGAGTSYEATIAANSITTAMLTDSGVTAGAYGNTTAIPVITVDAKGRVTSMSTSSVSGVTGLTWTGANNTLTVATSTTNYTANLNSWTNPVTFSNTVAAGNTTFTGYANVGTTLQVTGAAAMANTLAVTGNATFSNTLAVTGTSNFTGLITGTITSANNADYLDGYHAAAFAQLSGATYTGPVSGITTLAAGNTTITGWANVTGNTTVGGTLNAADVIISGNLTTSGTTTYINTTNLNVGDNLVVLNADLGIAAAPTEDAGLVINRGSAANVQFNWDETNDRWALGNTYITGTITSTSAGSIGGTLAAGNTTITGFANVSSTLQVTGAATFANTLNVTGLITGTVTSANNADYLDGQHGAYYAANSQLANYLLLAGGTLTGAVVSTAGANAFVFSNATSNYLTWSTSGVGAPTTTTRSAGTKLVLYPSMTSAGVDYGMGIESSYLWFSSYNDTSGFKWYANTTNIMTANTTGLNMNTRAISGVTTLAAGNTTITGFANVTGTIQGGSSLTIAGALSGVTTAAMGNTTITGHISVSGAALTQHGLVISKSFSGGGDTYAVARLFGTDSGIANTGVVIGQKGTGGFSGSDASPFYVLNNTTTSLWVSGANNNLGIGNTTPTHKLSVAGSGNFTGSVNVATTFAAGNTTITGFANVSSTLQVTGATSFANTLAVTGNTNLSYTLGITTPAWHIKLASSGGTGGNTWNIGSTDTGWGAGPGKFVIDNTGLSATAYFVIDSTGKVGIGNTAPADKLRVEGSFSAITKSFLISHPTKEGKTLRYSSLEGPENGVYVRGSANTLVIELPEYWIGLVDEETITVNLTAKGKSQTLYVESIANNIINVGTTASNKSPNYFYTVYAERKDVDKLVVEE